MGGRSSPILSQKIDNVQFFLAEGTNTMNAPFNNSIAPAVVVENPVEVVVQDYVTEKTPPRVYCTSRTIGLFMMASGVVVGIAVGLVYGFYSSKC